MISSPTQKSKINLSDYNYTQDVERRLLMSTFTVVDVEVLEELINGSLQTTVDSLADELDLDNESLLPILENLSRTDLFTLNGNEIYVDKEVRKYFDIQITKFDPHFQANMDYLQGLLTKVPIHSLPCWYSIPRTADHIFESICERYLSTPKTYSRYLEDLRFEDPTLEGIVKEVFSSPELKVSASSLQQQFSLSSEQFETYMLYLEFHLVCCLSYSRTGDRWEGIVTPFHEWRHYLLFLNETETPPIAEVERIVSHFDEDFAFIKNMSGLLKTLSEHPLTLENNHLSSDSLERLIEQNEQRSLPLPLVKEHYQQILATIVRMGFASFHNEQLRATALADHWFSMALEDQAIYLYRQPYQLSHIVEKAETPLCPRRVREAEKCLRRVLKKGWVLFDDFRLGITRPLKEGPGIHLERQGKAWGYHLPNYEPEDYELLKKTICERLFQAGMVQLGSFEGALCFRVTSFGLNALSG